MFTLFSSHCNSSKPQPLSPENIERGAHKETQNLMYKKKKYSTNTLKTSNNT